MGLDKEWGLLLGDWLETESATFSLEVVLNPAPYAALLSALVELPWFNNV